MEDKHQKEFPVLLFPMRIETRFIERGLMDQGNA